MLDEAAPDEEFSCESSVANTPITGEINVLVLKMGLGSATHAHFRNIPGAGL